MSLTYVSCGGGRQSTALAMMAIHEELDCDVRAILFADTGWERPATYANIAKLRTYSVEQGGPPVKTLTTSNIREDALNPEKRSPSLPVFVDTSHTLTPEHQLAKLEDLLANKVSSSQMTFLDAHDELNAFKKRLAAGQIQSVAVQKMGMLKRQCTGDYKIKPINHFIRADGEALGMPVTHKSPAVTLIGISLDEVTRMSPSSVKYIQRQYPLVEKRMRAADCIRYLKERGWEEPVRSSCIGCPYHSQREWQALTPAEWEDACRFDEELRDTGLTHPNQERTFGDNRLYLHRSLKPLRSLDLTADDEFDELADEECAGACFL